MRRLGVLIASVGGVGYAPIAPGTAGSAVGLVVFLLTSHWPAAWQVGLLLGITVVGTWAATETARHFGREDPGQVVVDEVAGQLVTCLFTGVTLTGAVLGFFIFRVLDIIKPWPARQLESLHGGVGIMADDLMAGIYGNLILQVLVFLLPAWL
jgi:phosphatidylglycerophosphatase A